ncbi:CBS domain-containing protein [Mongoliitalea daihaiensis]|uniref:CBS domain-containing protein n=1 Tax=Mongoliitalea daihaiensis TaxID=2782006 RepID=UPI001F2B44A2|nr:CBS domain-containing protein [Mongoliitalea daihaiensis]UJP66299.1 CBS domain-containing protein [Mongoliitalea daihaiensis]
MQAFEYINNLIPPLKVTDQTGKALLWMEEIRTNSLPVIQGKFFKGLISDEQIYNLNQPELTFESLELENQGCFVYLDKHIYDVIRTAAEFHTNMVAVLDKTNEYLGVITMEDAITAFADSLSIQSNGAVIVLSMLMTDYSMSEISRIIESENAKILSSFIASDPLDDNKIKLTLKLDKTELRHVKATLERFGYHVLDHYQEEAGVSEDQDRIDNLFRFLDI